MIWKCSAFVVVFASASTSRGAGFRWESVRHLTIGMNETAVIDAMGEPPRLLTMTTDSARLLTWSVEDGLEHGRSVTLPFVHGTLAAVPPIAAGTAPRQRLAVTVLQPVQTPPVWSITTANLIAPEMSVDEKWVRLHVGDRLLIQKRSSGAFIAGIVTRLSPVDATLDSYIVSRSDVKSIKALPAADELESGGD